MLFVAIGESREDVQNSDPRSLVEEGNIQNVDHIELETDRLFDRITRDHALFGQTRVVKNFLGAVSSTGRNRTSAELPNHRQALRERNHVPRTRIARTR
jgi:hypothetical protein